MTADDFRRDREALGWTQEELAAVMRTTQQRVSEWERGERDVPTARAAHMETLMELHRCRASEWKEG